MFLRHRQYQQHLQEPILVCFYFLTRYNRLAAEVGEVMVMELLQMEGSAAAAAVALLIIYPGVRRRGVTVVMAEAVAEQGLRVQPLLIPVVLVVLVVEAVALVLAVLVVTVVLVVAEAVPGIKHLVVLVVLVAEAVVVQIIHLVVLAALGLLHLLGRRVIK
jgi:hypothetical protein